MEPGGGGFQSFLPIILILVVFMFGRRFLGRLTGRKQAGPAEVFRPAVSDDEDTKRCSNCSKTTLIGHNFCPHCGSNAFVTVEEAPLNVNTRIADKVFRDRDIWVCGSCETDNELTLDNCKNCGKEYWPE